MKKQVFVCNYCAGEILVDKSWRSKLRRHIKEHDYYKPYLKKSAQFIKEQCFERITREK